MLGNCWNPAPRFSLPTIRSTGSSGFRPGTAEYSTVDWGYEAA
jgi:hypothetical protein